MTIPHKKYWPWLSATAILLLAVWQLRLQGRVWFCQCGQYRWWIADAYSFHTSQHLLDPYSFSHLQHGLVLFWIVGAVVRKWKFEWQCLLAIVVEVAWEVFENTEFVINRYREATAALGYSGDAIVNSMGDVLACWLGFLLAKKLGWRRTWVLFFTIEVAMLISIRDSLLLNILMLCFDIPWLKQWQQG